TAVTPSTPISCGQSAETIGAWHAACLLPRRPRPIALARRPTSPDKRRPTSSGAAHRPFAHHVTLAPPLPVTRRERFCLGGSDQPQVDNRSHPQGRSSSPTTGTALSASCPGRPATSTVARGSASLACRRSAEDFAVGQRLLEAGDPLVGDSGTAVQ